MLAQLNIQPKNRNVTRHVAERNSDLNYPKELLPFLNTSRAPNDVTKTTTVIWKNSGVFVGCSPTVFEKGKI